MAKCKPRDGSSISVKFTAGMQHTYNHTYCTFISIPMHAYLLAEEIVALDRVRKVREFLSFGSHLARGTVLHLFAWKRKPKHSFFLHNSQSCMCR